MKKRIGAQSPTQSIILPYESTFGEQAIEYYEESDREAYEWQENLVNPILATNDDGLWTHMEFGYSVPRQNGKNEIVAIRELYALEEGERVLHTAHLTSTSGAAFERLLAILEETGLTNQEDFTSLRAIGRESIEFPNGGRVDFRTRSSTGGLGESFDLLVIDEAQEYTDDQRSALTYTISASENPQTIYCGTPPTPISSGTVFTKYRDNTLGGLKEDAGWAEWSVDQESDVRDTELWYQTNPSLGLRINERTIQTEVGSDDTDFNIQRLGLWLQYNQQSVISEEEWDDLKVDILPQFKGKLYVGIKYGHDGENVAMSVAVKTEEDKVFVETIDCQTVRNGNAWLIAFLREADTRQVVIDGASGQNILADEMRDFSLKRPKLPTVKEIINANARFEQELYQQTIQHNGQPSLREVITNSDKRNIGSSGGFGYSSQMDDHDIILMDSMILAHWACVNDKRVKKQRVFY